MIDIKSVSPTKEEIEARRKDYAAGRQQLEVCRRKPIRFITANVPADMRCYHDRLILQCESWNCQIDSGRFSGQGGITH